MIGTDDAVGAGLQTDGAGFEERGTLPHFNLSGIVLQSYRYAALGAACGDDIGKGDCFSVSGAVGGGW